MAAIESRKIAVISILCLQAVLAVLFSIFVRYDPATADPLQVPQSPGNGTDFGRDSQYPLFQDVHVMVFVGFGFLMTFLRRYAFTSLGLTFLISSLTIQWGLLCRGFLRMNAADDGEIRLDLTSLIDADVSAATVLISLGAILGKVSPVQLIVMSVLETFFFAVNEFVGINILRAADAGGSMFVHVFGAYFGLAVSFALSRGVSAGDDETGLESSIYQSDINAMIGSLFLWMFWPSFNAASVFGEEKQRAILNTYLALTASCLTAFATSSAVGKTGKLDMVHVQNATLAGGVCVGTSANMLVQPWGALLIGGFAGILSTLGFRFVQGAVSRRLRIHDTCGVNNLHGMPGIAAGVVGAIMAASADVETYGKRLQEVFPAMGPSVGRTAWHQSGYQLLALTITFLTAAVTGLTTGLFIRNFKRIGRKFDDETLWEIPGEDSIVVGREIAER